MAKKHLLLSLGLPVLAWMFMSPGGKMAQAEAPRAVQVYAHRGARSFCPENTMPAYQASMRIGVDWVDMDICLTKDGEVVVGHDPVLNPDIVRDPQGHFLAKNRQSVPPAEVPAYIRKYAIKNLTLAEVQQFDVGRLNPESAYSKFFPEQHAVDGTHMPTLREVVRYINESSGNKVGFQIEMKTDPGHPEYSPDPKLFAQALFKVLDEENILDRAEIQAFDFRCLQELQKFSPKVKGAYLTSRENEKGGPDDFAAADQAKAGLWTGGKLVKDYGGSIPRMVKAMGGYAWEPEDFELSKESLKEAHSLGLKVVVWSWPEKLGMAFDPQLVDKMIEWGVDGIITDDPGRLISILAARGMPVPARLLK